MKFSVSQTFLALAIASIPDPEKVNTFKRLEFTCRFKSGENSPEAVDEAKRLQREQGNFGFLDQHLESVTFKIADIEFVDADGQAIEPIEWVKRNKNAGSAASLAYWDVINKDVDAKNSKRLHG